MAKFKYTAIDANGKQKTGTVEAASQDEASTKLNASGLMPTKITDAGGSAPAKASAQKNGKKSKKSGGFGKVIKAEDLTTFTRQLATLLDAGLPLLRALEVMIRQEKNARFQAVLEQIADQVKSGNSFPTVWHSTLRFLTAYSSTWCALVKPVVCSTSCSRVSRASWKKH